MNSLPPCPLRISSPAHEGSFQVAKWLHVQMLLDVQEMEDFLSYLGECYLIMTSKICQEKELFISKERFLEVYKAFIQGIKANTPLDRKYVQPYFSAVISYTAEAVYAAPVRENGYLAKPCRPVIQMQPFAIKWDRDLEQFMTKMLSPDVIPFGLQLSFPQLYQDPKTFDIIESYKDPHDQNATLFKAIQKWARDHSRPTPFIVDGKRVNASFRIGHEVLDWIHQYKLIQLAGLNIQVSK